MTRRDIPRTPVAGNLRGLPGPIPGGASPAGPASGLDACSDGIYPSARFGAPPATRRARRPSSPSMEPPARAQASVDLDGLARNLGLIRDVVGTGVGVVGVVKADAYGHGAVPVARRLLREGAWGVAAATPSEGAQLRTAGIDGRILVLGGSLAGDEATFVEHGLAVAIEDRDEAMRLDAAARSAGAPPVPVHVQVDTGMGRLGMPPAGLLTFLELVSTLPGVELEGVMTHLSSADGADDASRSFTEGQLARFEQTIAEARSRGFAIPHTHAANSAGSLHHRLAGCDLVRPGLALYGVEPRPPGTLPLVPVLEFRCSVLKIHRVGEGLPLSYGRRFVTGRPSRIAVLGAGYADGIPVALSNRGRVRIGNGSAPIVGAVTMDLTLVDVTDLPEVEVGDAATVLGGLHGPRAEEQADLAGTIPYELLCAVGRRVQRVWTDAAAGPSSVRGAG